MKFEDYKLKKDAYGFEFAKNNIMKGKDEQPCIQCGHRTKFIEVCSEANFCSDECVDEWYKKCDEIIENME